jgi:hypothetical protein
MTSDRGHHGSAPDLRQLPGINRCSSTSTLEKSGSMKKLSFHLDDVQVLPTYPKAAYNRKPDANMTFRKLTPKLKMEIREELNQFKRSEMSVHHESSQNTAFH